MKKILIIIMLFGIPFFACAQEDQTNDRLQTAIGSFAIDANTTFTSLGGIFGGNGTSFTLSSSDGMVIWNIGAEVGYFVTDNFALKFGLGYGDFDGSSYFSYKLGLKYYIAGRAPIQIDYSGQTGEDWFGDEKPSYLGLQAGYAIFLGDMVSLEPSLRYNLSLNNDYYEDIFQIQIGFTIFLN